MQATPKGCIRTTSQEFFKVYVFYLRATPQPEYSAKMVPILPNSSFAVILQIYQVATVIRRWPLMLATAHNILCFSSGWGETPCWPCLCCTIPQSRTMQCWNTCFVELADRSPLPTVPNLFSMLAKVNLPRIVVVGRVSPGSATLYSEPLPKHTSLPLCLRSEIVHMLARGS